MTKREEILKLDGTRCDTCGQVIHAVKLDCAGAKARKEPMPLLAACRCCHPGDFMCNCGKPCWSFF